MPTPTPRQTFGMQFSLLARRWRRMLGQELAAAGLSDAIWLPLVHLEEAGGNTVQKDLAQRVGVDASSLVRVLDILERQGLISRTADPSDGRAKRILLTGPGRDQLAVIRRQLIAIEEQILVDLGDEEIARMLRHIAQIDARIDARMQIGATEKTMGGAEQAPERAKGDGI